MQFSIIAKVINKHHTLSAEDCVSEPVRIKKKKEKERQDCNCCCCFVTIAPKFTVYIYRCNMNLFLCGRGLDISLSNNN